MNLLKETIKILKDHGLSLHDVEWIGSKDVQISMNDFMKFANEEYSDGYGGVEIFDDLIVVGKSWWLERYSYDGAEWWEYKALAKKPKNIIKVRGLNCSELNDKYDLYLFHETLEKVHEAIEKQEKKDKENAHG